MHPQKFENNFFIMSLHHFKTHIVKYSIALVSLSLLHWIQVQIPRLIMDLSNSSVQKSTLTIIGEFVLVAVGIIFFRTISRWFFFYPARVQQKDLRDKLLYKLSQSFPENWKNYTTGKLYEILISDLEEIRVFFGFALLQIANLCVALVILFPAMMNISSELMWSLVPLGIFFLLFSVSLVFTTNLSEQGRNEHDILQQMLVEFYDAKKTLNVFCKENSAAVEFSSQSNKELEYFLRVNLIRSITRPMILFGGGLSLIYAAYLVHVNQYPMSYLIVFSTFIFLLYEPLGYLSWIGIIMSETKVSWKRLNQLVTTLEESIKNGSKVEINNDKGLLFHYKAKSFDQQIILPISTQYLMIGSTASGKSTFLESLHYTSLKENVSSVYVPQDPYLFNQTLGNNLFLNLEMNNESIQKALKLIDVFELRTLCNSQEDILSLLVGEKGKKLSGGQVKRLHMVRSLLFDYELILWDDPFSALDVLTEKRILTELFTNFSTYFAGKIFMLTTHRRSTVKYFNEIIVCTRQGIELGKITDPLMKIKMDNFFDIHNNTANRVEYE